ncbi:MAG: aminopeptidase P family protein [Rhodospirillales bacterium]|nr:aminopeptidase P family protein [Rhodospirillales bacterium]
MNDGDRDDRHLGALLAAAGIHMAAGDVRDIVTGAAAAPKGYPPHAWKRLIAPDNILQGAPELSAQLSALFDREAVSEPNRGRDDSKIRLSRLRDILKKRDLDGFVVLRADANPGEFLPRRAERLAWLTGFTGSAGLAVVLHDRAAIFVDGRYTLQVRDQVDGDFYEFRHSIEEPYEDWLAEHLEPNRRFAYDPWLHTPNQAIRLHRACGGIGAELVALAGNPIDDLWDDQPAEPLSPMMPHGLEFAGEGSADKRQWLAETLRAAGEDAAFIAAPEYIAWLLNVLGGDVPYTPISLAFAILHADGTLDLFVDSRKIVAEIRRHLGNGVRLHGPEDLGGALDRLGREQAVIRVDGEGAPAWAWNRLEQAGAKPAKGADPCLLPKACKNETELAGMRAAHQRDGAALAEFLCWLQERSAGGDVTESRVVEKLNGFRARSDLFRGVSFETIAGAGPNGAIVHYRCSPETDRRLEAGSLLLLDSGAQYVDGTTDVTRTMAIGEPSEEMRSRFTLVLKGHIALARSVFPKGTKGPQLDAMARRPLWQAGLDFDHGTGHGVGSYLGVHEGPARISKAQSQQALEPGMVLSNEPGFYKTGEYGIRIENLVAVERRPDLGAEGHEFLGFETLTLVPIDHALIDAGILDMEERAWIDRYHARVFEQIGPLVEPGTQTWLRWATRPIG